MQCILNVYIFCAASNVNETVMPSLCKTIFILKLYTVYNTDFETHHCGPYKCIQCKSTTQTLGQR